MLLVVTVAVALVATAVDVRHVAGWERVLEHDEPVAYVAVVVW